MCMYLSNAIITKNTESSTIMSTYHLPVTNCGTNLPTFYVSHSLGQSDNSKCVCPTKNVDSYNYPKELIENLITINSFNDLSDNWDGEGAKGFSKYFLKFVSNVVSSLSLQPEIFPLQDGSIQFEFGNVKSKYLEFCISPNKKMNIYKKNIVGNRIREDNLVFSINKVQEEIKWYESTV